jgi:hypothetical protein
LKSEALARVKVTGNARYIRLSPQPVNDNFMAKTRIYWPIWDYNFLWRIINSPGAQFVINLPTPPCASCFSPLRC